MAYKYYTKNYYSTVCHVLEFDPREFRLDVSLGVLGKLETIPNIAGQPKEDEKVIAKMNASFFAMNSKEDTYSTFVDEGLFYHLSCPGYPTLIFWKDYTMTVEHDPTQDRLSYFQEHAFFAIGAGWTLIIDGKIDFTYDKQTLINMFGHPYQRNPRTMIGQKADGTIVMVATNGRVSNSLGLTTDHMAQVMLKLGCVIAVNMDGGGSTEMFIGDKTINYLANNYHRPIGTAFIVYGPHSNNQVVVKVPEVNNTNTVKGEVINIANLNIRSGPGTAYSLMGTIPKGTPVKVLGTNASGKWYNLSCTGFKSGWVNGAYIKITSMVKATTMDLNLRAGRGTNYKLLAVMPKGTKVEVSDLESGWYKVKYNGMTGYSNASYFK